MLEYVEPVYRPPSEADSLILQATIGCSHNRCRFCYMYKEKHFRIKPWEDLRAEIDAAAELAPETRRIFLADGDACALPAARLLQILEYLARVFPRLQRVTAYATPQNLLRKSAEEMRSLVAAGLRILYYGVESGDAELLRRIDKGATPDAMAEGCRRAQAAGFKLSITAVLGLAGKAGGLRHARATAELINRISPRYFSLLTLMLGPFEDEYRAGMGDGFEFNGPLDDLRELREVLAHLRVENCIFRSNHASNNLALAGRLPEDQERLLAEVEAALGDPAARLRPDWARGL